MRIPRTEIQIEPGLCWLLAILLLTVPVRWLLAWFIAVAVHELGHYLALTTCKVPVPVIRFGPSGAAMQTRLLSCDETAVCAAAGPIAGLLLLFFSRVAPVLSICAFVQSIYNLLPIPHHDGDRILQCVCSLVFPESIAMAVHKALRTCILILGTGGVLLLISI